MRERMRRTASIQIAIVDDHEVVRQGLRLSLELEADMAVGGKARTSAEAIDLARQRQPDVMLLDVRLGDLDGPEVCRRVLDVAPRTAVVMLTNYLQDGLVFRSLAAGAKGYVIRPQKSPARSSQPRPAPPPQTPHHRRRLRDNLCHPRSFPHRARRCRPPARADLSRQASIRANGIRKRSKAYRPRKAWGVSSPGRTGMDLVGVRSR